MAFMLKLEVTISNPVSLGIELNPKPSTNSYQHFDINWYGTLNPKSSTDTYQRSSITRFELNPKP